MSINPYLYFIINALLFIVAGLFKLRANAAYIPNLTGNYLRRKHYLSQLDHAKDNITFDRIMDQQPKYWVYHRSAVAFTIVGIILAIVGAIKLL